MNLKTQQNSNKIIIYNPYPLKGGGGEIQMELLKIIKDCFTKHEVNLFSTANSKQGIKLYIHRLSSVIKFRKELDRVEMLIIQSIFDPGSLLLGYLARIKKIPYYVIPRGDYVPTKENFFITQNYIVKRFIWSMFSVKLVKHAISVIVTSDYEKNRLQKVNCDEICFVVIPDPTFEKIIDNRINNKILNKELLRYSEVPFALWLGRIAKEKGLDLLIDSWLDVTIKTPSAVLLLVGSITHLNEYKRLVKKLRALKLENSIIFLNWVTGEEKNYLLSKARCLLLPSYYESFGIVVVEALSNRTPVIVSSGTPWKHLNNKAGLCLPREKVAWSAAISNYIVAPTKILVPDSVINEMMEPYNKSKIFNKWFDMFNRQNSSRLCLGVVH